MVNFGERIRSEAYAPWIQGYFRYDFFKQEMKRMDQEGAAISQRGTGTPPPEDAKVDEGTVDVATTVSESDSVARSVTFGDKLGEEVKRVEIFASNIKSDLAGRINDLETRWKTVQQWIASGFPDVHTHEANIKVELANVSMDLQRLLDFIALNVEGVRKVMKKHDKVTGENSGPMLLAKLQTGTDRAYLQLLTDTTEIESLVTRVNAMNTAIAESVSKSRLLSNQEASDNFSRPVSAYDRLARSTSSDEDTQETQHRKRRSRVNLEYAWKTLESTNWYTLLARGLHVVDDQGTPSPTSPRPNYTPDFRGVHIALIGATLAGLGWGAFLETLSRVSALTAAARPLAEGVEETKTYFLGSSDPLMILGVTALGAFSGARPSFTELYPGMLAIAGAVGCLGIFSPRHGGGDKWRMSLPLVWCWGMCMGAWVAQIPRRLVRDAEMIGRKYQAMTALAPVAGIWLGAMLTQLLIPSPNLDGSAVPPHFPLSWAAASFWLFLALIISQHHYLFVMAQFGSTTPPVIFPEDSVASRGGPSTEATRLMSTSAASADLEASRPPPALRRWTEASSSRAAAWGSLACVALVRGARTLMLISVIALDAHPAFFPWLATLSLVAFPFGALVPAWICNGFAFVSIFALPDISFAWMWTEAALRASLGHVPTSEAGSSDAVLVLSDIVAVLLALVIRASNVETPNVDVLRLAAAVVLVAAGGEYVTDKV